MSKNYTPLTATLVFTLLNFLQPALNIFLLPLYLNELPAEAYGIFTLMNNLSSLILIIASLRISAAVIPYYFDFRYSDRRLKFFLKTVLSFALLASAIFLVISLLLGPWLFGCLFKSSSISFYPYGLLAISTGLLGGIASPYLLFVKNEKRIGHFAVLQIIVVTLTVGLQVVFILALRQGAFGALMAKLIAQGILVLIIFIAIRKWFRFRLHRYYLYRSLQFSLPLLPFLIINWLNVFGDRFFMERYFDLRTLGIYGTIMTLAGMIPMALDAVVNGIRPYLFDYFSEGVEGNKSAIDQLYRLYFSVLILAISGIILVGTNIGLLTDRADYLEIIPFMPLAALLFFFRAYIFIFNQQLVYSKQSRIISGLSIALITFLAIFFFVLIPRFGINGALWANLLVNFLMAILFAYFSQRAFRIEHSIKLLLIFPISFLLPVVVLSLFAKWQVLSYPLMGLIQFILVGVGLLFSFRKIKLTPTALPE